MSREIAKISVGSALSRVQMLAFVATAVATDNRVVGTGRNLGEVSSLWLLNCRYSWAVRTHEGEELVKLTERAVAPELCNIKARWRGGFRDLSICVEDMRIEAGRGTGQLGQVEASDPSAELGGHCSDDSTNHCRSCNLQNSRGSSGGLDRVNSTEEVQGWPQFRWHKLPAMRDVKHALAVVALSDGRVFALGGWNGEYCRASVDFCHFQANWSHTIKTTKFWRPLEPMRTPRYVHAAVAFKGKIIVAGGYIRDEANRRIQQSVVEVFSPPDAERPLGEWTRIADLLVPRAVLTLLVYKDWLYALGGAANRKNTIEEFIPDDPRL
ncbi:unnamed protein product [Dibothriocephalus latus]|uniref:Kelch repeat protein n=1 Tax=Dibothriocephalus latus TaxID=60516 RepID=A0A3P7PCD6_DIBLA|nr:unnamed protein product [Dibothriocephalus latus]